MKKYNKVFICLKIPSSLRSKRKIYFLCVFKVSSVLQVFHLCTVAYSKMFLSPDRLMWSHRYKFYHTDRNIRMLLHCINNYTFPRIQRRIFLLCQKSRLNKVFMNSSSICISFLFSSYSYENVYKFYMFTSLMYKLSHRNGKSLKIITNVSGSIMHFRNLSAHSWAEFCAVWWDSLYKTGKFQTNISKRVRTVPVHPNWQTSVAFCCFEKSVSLELCLRLWELISTQNARSVC